MDNQIQIFDLLKEMNKEMNSMKSEMNKEMKSIRTEMSNMKSETNKEMKSMRTEMSSMKSETNKEIKSMRSEMNNRFDTIEAKLEGVGQQFELTNESRINEMDFIVDKIIKIEKEVYILKNRNGN